MSTNVVGRPTESRAVADFLATVSTGPTALIVEGEAGIGKTTLWLGARERAEELGFRVLSTRASSAESVLAYSSLASLLGGLEDDAFSTLPPPQRHAVDRVLLRVDDDGPVTDQRAIAAGFLAVIGRLAEKSPVLLAIDDMQWLDAASVRIISAIARRLTGAIGVLATVRTGPDGDGPDTGTWLELPRPDAVSRVRVRPLSLGALHAVVSDRLGRSFSRPKMLQIQEISGGNPFYALELARAMDESSGTAGTSLPSTLAGLVRSRIGSLTMQTQEALLAAACVAGPTVELVARANDVSADHVVSVLEEAEANGIITFDGHLLHFSHPLLVRGVYSDATPARRRAMHRRLGEIVEEPELKARHLALAAASGDPLTLRSLDDAAVLARIRGAPAAAAELLELAISLGGDTPQRRIFAAGNHYEAGDPGLARAQLLRALDGLAPGALRSKAMGLLAVVHLYDDSFIEAADLLERAIAESGDDVAARVQMSVMLSYALFTAGRLEVAVQHVDSAVAQAAGLDQPGLMSQALGMRVMLHFLIGDGLDESSMLRALELGDGAAGMPVVARPSVQNALLLAWTGQLAAAATRLADIRSSCVEHGEESELIFVDFHMALLEIWRGNFAGAQLVSDDTMERAQQLNGDLPIFIALTIRATLGAYAGRAEEAKRDIAEALSAGQRCGSTRLTEWPITSLGFLEVSLGNYEAALCTLGPLLADLDRRPRATEIIYASFVPDAVEALVALGQIPEAEGLADVLESNGRRLDRAWLLAVGARSRSMVLAAQGEIEAASQAAQRAMDHHDRLPIPFERARTQLLLGQLQRRLRHKDIASATLRQALTTFEELGIPLWAARARDELARADVNRRGAGGLTASEQRVAELAASGVTNRDMAAALFISPKTVEANLTRIYRKLNIHSRAELGRLMGKGEG